MDNFSFLSVEAVWPNVLLVRHQHTSIQNQYIENTTYAGLLNRGVEAYAPLYVPDLRQDPKKVQKMCKAQFLHLKHKVYNNWKDGQKMQHSCLMTLLLLEYLWETGRFTDGIFF